MKGQRLPLAKIQEIEPESNLLQVGDLAKRTAKTVRAVHLYEELGLLQPVKRSKGRYRLYSEDALVRIKWISTLQELGFSLSDIQRSIKEWEETGKASLAMKKMREAYEQKLAETAEQITKMKALETELRKSLEYLDSCNELCKPDRVLSDCTDCNLHVKTENPQEIPSLVAGFRTSY